MAIRFIVCVFYLIFFTACSNTGFQGQTKRDVKPTNSDAAGIADGLLGSGSKDGDNLADGLLGSGSKGGEDGGNDSILGGAKPTGGKTNGNGPLPATPKDYCTRDLVVTIILDGSGTMRKDVEQLKKASGDFITKLISNDIIGIVSFSTQAQFISELTLDKTSAANKINAFTNVNGSTAIGLGLQFAKNQLMNIASRTRVAILLSDGGQNSGIAPGPVANEMKTANIRIISIYFPLTTPQGKTMDGGPGSMLMKGIATSEKDYYSTSDTLDYTKIYESIALSLCRP